MSKNAQNHLHTKPQLPNPPTPSLPTQPSWQTPKIHQKEAMQAPEMDLTLKKEIMKKVKLETNTGLLSPNRQTRQHRKHKQETHKDPDMEETTSIQKRP